jgi:hypothetical protein
MVEISFFDIKSPFISSMCYMMTKVYKFVSSIVTRTKWKSLFTRRWNWLCKKKWVRIDIQNSSRHSTTRFILKRRGIGVNLLKPVTSLVDRLGWCGSMEMSKGKGWSFSRF